ncbi:hypothetical protein [Aneurinibacillus uraniidurans]|uniref:hypothetical protein n=1 Tax=Aneurinibacillus uraniidurans TaxID=2966586 RepID=UPI00234B1A5F|nr:hypothetical protein [Aneurinibacillus sp. B1]WCN36217.1 hypothetical protein PO771_09950 [Aneurinibacillus sp. B1]
MNDDRREKIIKELTSLDLFELQQYITDRFYDYRERNNDFLDDFINLISPDIILPLKTKEALTDYYKTHWKKYNYKLNSNQIVIDQVKQDFFSHLIDTYIVFREEIAKKIKKERIDQFLKLTHSYIQENKLSDILLGLDVPVHEACIFFDIFKKRLHQEKVLNNS